MMKSVPCYIIENDPRQKSDVEAALRDALAPEYEIGVVKHFDDLEKCLSYVTTKKGRAPLLVLADLYRSEPMGDESIEDVGRVIRKKRIPLLRKLRQALGGNTILVVVSRYPELLEAGYKRNGEPELGAQMKEEICELLVKAGTDVIVYKLRLPDEGMPEVKLLMRDRFGGDQNGQE